jgi:hypothetical protein
MGQMRRDFLGSRVSVFVPGISPEFGCGLGPAGLHAMRKHDFPRTLFVPNRISPAHFSTSTEKGRSPKISKNLARAASRLAART